MIIPRSLEEHAYMYVLLCICEYQAKFMRANSSQAFTCYKLSVAVF